MISRQLWGISVKNDGDGEEGTPAPGNIKEFKWWWAWGSTRWVPFFNLIQTQTLMVLVIEQHKGSGGSDRKGDDKADGDGAERYSGLCSAADGDGDPLLPS